MTASSFGGDGQLKWRSVGSKPSRGMATQAVYHSKRGRVSSSRFVDRNVQTVAYNDPYSRASEQSVVSKGAQGVRLAQDNAALDFGDELQRQFETPMGDEGPIAPPDFDGPLPFEELPPKPEDTAPPIPPMEEPADTLPPIIEDSAPQPPIESPAQPKFDPFDESDLAPEPVEVKPLETAPREMPADNGDEPDRRRTEREEATQDCAEELAELRASNLSMLDITIGKIGVEGEDYPFVCSIDDGIPLTPRSWEPVTYMWKASALCHKPLYFEQEQLERYGHSWGPFLQPVFSGAHFFGHLAVLPYSMGLKAPNECVYALGHYRPGNCAPYMIPAVPFTWRAALFQAGAATGAATVIP